MQSIIEDAAAKRPIVEPAAQSAIVTRVLGSAAEREEMMSGDRKVVANPWWWALADSPLSNLPRRVRKLAATFQEPLTIVAGAARLVAATMKAKWAGKKDAEWAAAADDLMAKNPTLPLLGAGSAADKARATRRMLKSALQSVVQNTNWMTAFDAEKISAHMVRILIGSVQDCC